MVDDMHMQHRTLDCKQKFDWVVERVANVKPRLSLVEQMTVQRGTIQDWRTLEELHYKQSGSLPAGSHHFTLKLEDELIGVLVMASPKLLLKERHVVLPRLKPDGKDTKLTNQYRMKWINANMSVVARVVVVERADVGRPLAQRSLVLAHSSAHGNASSTVQPRSPPRSPSSPSIATAPRQSPSQPSSPLR